MKNNITKRILAIALATTMALSNVPMNSVYAAEESTTEISTENTTEEITTTEENTTEEVPSTEETTEVETTTEEITTEEVTTTEEKITTEEETTTEEVTTEETTTEEKTTETEVELIVFDHIYNDVDASNIKSTDLFVQTSDSTVFTKNTNVVSNYEDIYIISCSNVDEAKSVYSYYLDKVDFICDLQDTIELCDETETNEEDIADLSDVNNGQDDAIALLEPTMAEAEAALEEVKDKDYSDYIALIDSGVNTDEVDFGENDVTLSVIDEDSEFKDNVDHGTKMYSYIKEENPNAKIMSIKAFDSNKTDVASIYAAIKLAIENKVSVINLSFVGYDIEDNIIIKDVINEAIANGITVIGSAGNVKSSSKGFIVGCIENAITVGAVNEDGTLYETSNYDADLYVVATSTSEAAARYSGIYTSGKESDKVFLDLNTNIETDSTETTDTTEATTTDANADVDIDEFELAASPFPSSLTCNVTINVNAGDSSFAKSVENGSTYATINSYSPATIKVGGNNKNMSDLKSGGPYLECLRHGAANPNGNATFNVTLSRKSASSDSWGYYATYKAEISSTKISSNYYDAPEGSDEGYQVIEIEVDFKVKKPASSKLYLNKTMEDEGGTRHKYQDYVWFAIFKDAEHKTFLGYMLSNQNTAGNAARIFKNDIWDNSTNDFTTAKWEDEKGTKHAWNAHSTSGTRNPHYSSHVINSTNEDTDGAVFKDSENIPVGTTLYYVELGYRVGQNETVPTGTDKRSGDSIVQEGASSEADIAGYYIKPYYTSSDGTVHVSNKRLKGTIKTVGGSVTKASKTLINSTSPSQYYVAFLKRDARNTNKTIGNCTLTLSFYDNTNGTGTPYKSVNVTTYNNGIGFYNVSKEFTAKDTNGNYLHSASNWSCYITAEPVAPAGYDKVVVPQKLTLRQSDFTIDSDYIEDLTASDLDELEVNYVNEPPKPRFISCRKTVTVKNAQGVDEVKGLNGVTFTATTNNSNVKFVNSSNQEVNSISVTTSTVNNKDGIALVKVVCPVGETFTITFTETGAPAFVWNYSPDGGTTYPNRNKTMLVYADSKANNYTTTADATSDLHTNSYTLSNNYDYKYTLVKTSTKDKSGNTNYDLTGATYELYESKYNAQGQATGVDTSKKVATLVCNGSGITSTISVKAKMRTVNNVPQDTTFWLKETKPGNKGYLISTNDYISVVIKADHSSEEKSGTNKGVTVSKVSDPPVNDPLQIKITKTDAFGETVDDVKNGGVVFEWKWYKEPMSGDKIYTRQELLTNCTPVLTGTVATDANGVMDLHINQPFDRGYIVLSEKSYPEKYNGNCTITVKSGTNNIDISNDFYFITDAIPDPNNMTLPITQTWYPNGAKTYTELQSKGIKFLDRENAADIEVNASNIPIRGNIKLTKINEVTGEPMQGVKFSVKNLYTGETHYFYTDKDGNFTSAVSALTDYTEHEDLINYWDTHEYDPTIEGTTIWFSLQNDKKTTVQPKDWKDLLVPGALWGTNIDGDTFGDYEINELSCDANKGMQLIKGLKVRITTSGQIVDVFDPDASESENKLWDTVKPEIHTQARVKDTSTSDTDISQTLATKNDDVSPTSEDKVVNYTDQTIEDKVYYSKLRAKGTTYAVLSKLMLVTEVLDDDGKATGETIVEAYKDKDGNEVKNMTKFTTPMEYTKSLYEITDEHVITFEHIDGTAFVSHMDINGKDTKVKQHLVVYESLYLDEDYADLAALEAAIENKTFKTRYDEYDENDNMDFFPVTHEDPTVLTQTIYGPIIHTTIANNPTLDHIGNAEKVTVTDKVYYTGLTVGKEYTITGSIVVKEGTDFTNIEYDPSNPNANSEGFVITITTNTDNNTTDTNNETDSNGNTADEIAKETIDEEFKKNPNKAYFLKDANDKIVEQSITFVADSRDGYKELTFEIDATELEGKTTVAFEKLSYGNIIIASHTDLHDEDQAVHFPKIGTTTINSQVKFEDVVADENKEDTNTSDNTNTTTTDTNTTDNTNTTDTTNTDTNTTNNDTTNTETTDTTNENKEVVLDDGKACSKQVKADKDESFIDRISYTNLLANRTYHVYGELYDKETGAIMVDASGKPIKADMEYKTPEVGEIVIDKTPLAVNYILEDGTILDLTGDHADYMCNGNIDLEFTGYDFTNLANKTGVVYEEVYLVKETTDEDGNKTTEELLVASHKKIDDIDEFVYFADLGTKAVDDTTKIQLVPYNTDTILKDTVKFDNIIPNKKYTITANVVVKDDKSGTYKDGDFLKDKDGNIVTATVEFTPTKDNSTIKDGRAYGETTVDIPINTSTIKGLNLVVFEDIKNMYGVSIATHADINDEGQTIRVPDGHTEATDDESGSQITCADKEMKITDKIYFENLIVGETYVATGTVYRQDTEKPLLKDGKPITTTVAFKPTSSSGYINVPFTIDTSELATKKIVFFEDVTYNDVPVIVHHDINDDKQTITVQMTMNIDIAKADKDNIKYFLKGAEITIYDDKDNIVKDVDGKDCVGITDENGHVEFNVIYNDKVIYYAKETKAPNGYNINNNKFEIKPTTEHDKEHKNIIKVTILDTAISIPPTPKTGELILFILIGIAAISTSGIIIFRKKKKVIKND